VAPLKGWIAVTLGGCAVIALAYVPPRGATSRPRSFTAQVPELTRARLRVQALADAWRDTDGAARLLEDRQRVREILASQEDGHYGRPTIIVRGAEDSPAAVRYIEAALDTAWEALGLGETKVRVAVVVELARQRNVADRPTPEERAAYLAPDSTDRTTCIALLPAGPYWTRFLLGKRGARDAGSGGFPQWLQAGLGPCAFYAAYGTPGKPVRRWLAARNWDLALYLGSRGIAGERFTSLDLLGDPRYPWYWDNVYTFSPATVACLAGRSSGCRTAVLEGSDSVAPGAGPQIVRSERRWWRAQRLLPGELYLSDVARDVGRERFQGFWASSLPVDTALAAALKQPIGEWTEQWERRFIAPIHLGAAAPLGAAAVALLFGSVGVLAVMLTASLRQVR
jgi:hypothetical protein